MMDSLKNDSRLFCERWASIESKEWKFGVDYDSLWRSCPWKVRFYDLHRWNGRLNHWNGHDVGSGFGKSKREAWKSMETAIFAYEHAKTREEALMKAELRNNRDLQKGWGVLEYNAYYK